MLTIWSAPNYCFRFHNKGFAVRVAEKGVPLQFVEVAEAPESKQIEATVAESVGQIDKFFF